MEKLKTIWWLLLWMASANAFEPKISPDEVLNSTVEIQICCALDLSLKNINCARLNGRRSYEWIFPPEIMAENVSTRFDLEIQKRKCDSNKTTTVHLGTNTANKLLHNGYLKIEREFYHPDEYCINGKNSTSLEILICPQPCSSNRPCIKKCCGLDKVYSFGVDPSLAKGCQPTTGEYFQPSFYKSFSSPSTLEKAAVHFTENSPADFRWSCSENRTSFFVFPEASQMLNDHYGIDFTGIIFRVREDGKFLLRRDKDGRCILLEPDSTTCVDGIVNYGKSNLSYVNGPNEIVFFKCILPPPKEAESNENHLFGHIYGWVMVTSSIFLLLTIATYIALWERQTLHNWTCFSHIVSMFFMYIFLAVAHIVGVTFKNEYLGSVGCTGIAIISHFFFLSTFSWMLIISMDLWLTFRSLTPRSGVKESGVNRYINYSIFGWGLPFGIVIIGIALDAKYPDSDCNNVILAAYGRESCFLQQEARGQYLYYPVSLMMILNIVFFSMTTFKLYKYNGDRLKMTKKDDKQTQFYRLFLKLIFVMGVLWVLEIISWIISGDRGYHGGYWIVVDMLNVLRALALFIIYVCKQDVISPLQEKYTWLKPILFPIEWLLTRKNVSQEEIPTPGTEEAEMSVK